MSLLKSIIDNFLCSENAVAAWGSLGSIAVIITLVFIIFQLKAARNNNLVTIFQSLDHVWSSDEMKKARNTVCQNYLDNLVQIHRIEERVIGFYEDLGIYMYNKAISRRAIWDKYSYDIGFYWNILEKSIKEIRTVNNDKSFYERFEKMYKMCKRKCKIRKIQFTFSDRDIKHFIETEFLMTKEE